MATPLPFIGADPPTTAANNSPYLQLAVNTLITLLPCIGTVVLILLAMSIYNICRQRRRLRETQQQQQAQQQPPASIEADADAHAHAEVVDFFPWDEFRMIMELAERGYPRRRVEKIPVTVYSREGENETCAICLEELEEGEEVKVMPRCRHTFHGDCIDQWLGVRSASCPVCRDVIAEKESERERERDDIAIDIPMGDLSTPAMASDVVLRST